MTKLLNILPWVLLVVAVLLWYDGCRTIKSNSDLYTATQDSLHTSIDSEGRQLAKIALLETGSAKDFLKLQTNDTTIKALQGLVREYKGKLYSATILSNSTNETGVTASITENIDTTIENGVTIVYPRYTSTWSEQWSIGTIIATKDSISRNITIKNEYEITQGRQRTGFLKPKETVVSIKNLNPNTTTEELRTIRISDASRFSFGPQAGAGILITPNGEMRLGFYAGFGAQYRL